MGSKVCFIISPIGSEGSEIRQQADDLMELIIEPALQKYRFQVVRADKIPRPAVITADIVELVQNAELCIIDLTRHNPNVFYECGRRHETGKPFIQMLQKGEDLPFDVAGIRTLAYDMSSPRSVLESIKSIQSFVDEFEKTGYTTTSSGVSLSTIASSIERIERRLTQIVASGAGTQSAKSGASSESIFDAFKPPREAFIEAVNSGDPDRVAVVLPKLKPLGADDFITGAVLLAKAGDERGSQAILGYLGEHFSELNYETFLSAITGLVQYYYATDREREGLPQVKKHVEKFVKEHKLTPVEEASLLNQIQRVTYGAGDYEEALQGALRVIELVPDDATYILNVSLIYEEIGRSHDAQMMVDRYMLLTDVDEDHLSHAVEVYVAVGRHEDARKAFERLAILDGETANLLLKLNPKIRAAVQLSRGSTASG